MPAGLPWTKTERNLHKLDQNASHNDMDHYQTITKERTPGTRNSRAAHSPTITKCETQCPDKRLYCSREDQKWEVPKMKNGPILQNRGHSVKYTETELPCWTLHWQSKWSSRRIKWLVRSYIEATYSKSQSWPTLKSLHSSMLFCDQAR